MKPVLLFFILIPCVVSAELRVVVTPNPEQTLLGAQVIDSVASSSSSSSDTAELLAVLPGVSMQSGGGVSALPSIRGLADDRIRIKVDGMDLVSACGNHMNPPLSYIDPTAVSSVQVFAGVTPVSMGGDSIAGAILVNSMPPVFAESSEVLLHEGEVGAFYRSNGRARGGNIAMTLATEQLSFNYQGASAQSDNYKAGGDFKAAGSGAAGRRYLSADEVGSSYYESHNHTLDMAFQQGEHLWQLKLGVQNIPEQGWSNQRMDMTENSSNQINLSYAGQLAWGDLELRLYQENTQHEMQFGEDKLFWYGSVGGVPNPDGIPCSPSGGMAGCAAGMPMQTEGKNTGLNIKSSWQLSAQDTLRLGVEAQQFRLDDYWNPSGLGMWPNTFKSVNDGQRDRLALFAEFETSWSSKLLTQLGARVEQVKMNTGTVQGYNAMMANYVAESAAFNGAQRAKTDHNLDLAALLRFSPSATYSMELAYAQKTRSPNLYERYAWSTGGMVMRMVNMAGDGNGYVGNVNLQPEIAHTISSSLQWGSKQPQAWELKLSPHFTYIDDYIDAARCSSVNMNCGAANFTATNQFVYLQYSNQPAQLWGADVSGHYQLSEYTAMGSFSLAAVVSYLDGKNKTTQDSLYNLMPLNAQLALLHSKGNWSNRLEVEWTDSKSDVSAVRNELTTSAYHVLNLRAQYSKGRLGINFGVENVLDTFYHLPLGGAYIGQGKTMPAAGVAWGTALPGRGRSIYTGLNYKF